MPKNKITFDKEDSEIIGLTINEKYFSVEEGGWVEVDVSDFKGFNISSIPRGIRFFPIEGNTIFFEGEISSGRKYPGVASMNVHIYRKYWDHKYGALMFMQAMENVVRERQKSQHDVKFIELEDDGAHLFFRYEIYLPKDMPVDEALKHFQGMVKEIEGSTERLLEGAMISRDVLGNEVKYTVEVLLPLFRKMGFVDVRYNHGNREFGKDITFSEFDKFGARRNYGAQVKAGDVSGGAGSYIDTILAQIEDAFTMPYTEILSQEKRYLTDLIIAISGSFTENAKQKIIEKVKRRNIYFLDLQKTQELLEQHFAKRVSA